jgi:hypothetical protein
MPYTMHRAARRVSIPVERQRCSTGIAPRRQDLSKKDIFLAQRHLRNVFGGPVAIYPTPDHNVFAAIQGTYIGLLETINQYAKLRFLLDRAFGRYDKRKLDDLAVAIA